MEYVTGPKSAACIFCEFAAAPREKWRELLVLRVEQHALVVLNRYPFASSHLLVAPKRHVARLEDLPDAEYEATMRLVRDAAARLRTAVGAEALNVGLNLGPAAGAGIAEHLHAHVVPRWPGDTNFMPVLADIRVIPEYLDATWAKLEPVFASAGR
jgi:ATP adenylyltransferase